MNIAILHLSDFHFCKDQQVVTEKIDKLVDSLEVLDSFDECMILFTGDLTHSGDEKEFAPAKYTFGRLIAGIRSKYKMPHIPLLCIPGNHDLVLTSESRKIADIRTYFDNNDVDAHLNDEFEAMNAYFTFEYPNNRTWNNKLLCKWFQSYGDFRIQLNLINTAPFSTLVPDDKESHYFPNEMMHQLRKSDNSSICITMMHHGIEWFDWSCKGPLEKAIYDNSEFLLTGHDHIGSGRSVSFSNDSGVWVSAAGEMNFCKYVFEDSFNAIVINTENNTFSGYMFSWNDQNGIFVHNNQITDKEISSKSNKLVPKASFLREMKTDQRHKISSDFIDYYVFPKLRVSSSSQYEKQKTIQTYEEFLRHIQSNKVTYIDGENNSGKTSLLRYVYLKLSENAIPLLWSASEETVSIAGIPKILFVNQYGDDPLLFEKYEQSNSRDKYLLVDDWHSISSKKQEALLTSVCNRFAHIIISRNTSYYNQDCDLELIEEEIKDTIIKPEENNSPLRIEPFYLSKRTELVKNICSFASLNEGDIERINNAINSLVQDHTSMFILNPEFIIQYAGYFTKEDQYNYQTGEKLFSKIFEHNITNLILDATSPANVEEYITVLEEIAAYMQHNRKSCLTQAVVEEIITTYNKEYSANVSPRKFMQTMFRAKILRFVANSLNVTYANKNYLSYFIARYICRNISNNDDYDDLEYCIKYISFGLNADILLFVTYITRNTRIVTAISKMARGLMDTWKDLFIENDFPNLIGSIPANIIPNIHAPSDEDKEIDGAINESNEERLHEQTSISTLDVYDFDINRKRSIKHT